MAAIVVGYDGSECARRALERAAGLLADGDELHVVAAGRITAGVKGSVGAVDPIEAEDIRSALDEAGTLLRERGIEPRLVEGRGDPAKVLTSEAQEVNADLIVVGTHGRGPVGRAVLGSVSTGVVHHAACDVLVVR
jgi:nucleotide-binding universal stress UspA family protein